MGACSTTGQLCDNDDECLGDEECAETPQAEGHCFVPCDNDDECSDGTECEHGHCLFDCDNDDDCEAYPNLECRHMHTLCEVD